MVVDDEPLAIDSAKYEREVAGDGRHFTGEPPAAEHEGRGVTERSYLQLGEFQLPHLLAGRIAPEVVLPVLVQPRVVSPPELNVNSSEFQ